MISNIETVNILPADKIDSKCQRPPPNQEHVRQTRFSDVIFFFFCAQKTREIVQRPKK